MDCVILAAGEGKRMRPLTSSRPKVMLPVAGKPMLEHLIIEAKKAGIADFILVVGYMENEIRSYFGNGAELGVSIKYAVQRSQRGTADAVLAAEGLTGSEFILLNGDMILKSADIKSFISQPVPCVGTFESSHPQDFGVVVSDESGVVKTLVEKSPNPPGNTINAGIYSFDSGVFEILRKLTLSPRGEYELTDGLMVYISKSRLHSFTLSEWSDIGEPWNLLDANERMMNAMDADEFKAEGKIEDGVFINAPVSLGKGSVIKSGTYIEGPCIIGENTQVGPHAYLRGACSIGDNCHIGHSVELKNSIVFSGTKIPHFNYVGDSVIGSDCNFGAGTKVANLRHDNKNVRCGGRDTGRRKFGAVIGDKVKFGINCSVNAGSMIGSGVKCHPGAFVTGKIDDGTIIR